MAQGKESKENKNIPVRLSDRTRKHLRQLQRAAEDRGDKPIPTFADLVDYFLFGENPEALGENSSGHEIVTRRNIDAPPSPWVKKLEFVLKCNKKDAVAAVQHNLDVFYKYCGGESEKANEPGTSKAATHPEREPAGSRGRR